MVEHSAGSFVGPMASLGSSKYLMSIEPMFAEGKLWHGMRRFRLRGLEKVNTEALLIAAGQNMKRLLAFGGRGPKKLAQAAAQRPAHRPRPDLAHRTSRELRQKRRIDSRFSTRWTVFGTLRRTH